jgi:predicted ThiF/HesA family dinucleotide-utilizing enzyme
MQDNTQNTWRTLLDDPEHFAGETIRDKNVAWEKLYSRLHEKSRGKFVGWYWAAASILILITSGLLLVVNTGTRQGIAAKGRSSVRKQAAIVTQKKEDVQPKENNYAQLKPRQKNHLIVEERRKIRADALQPVNNHLILDSVNQQMTELIGSRPVAIDTIKTIATAAAPKKKLRVVHINETGQPAEEPMVNNRFSDTHVFGFKILIHDNYDPINNNFSNNILILTKPRNTPN